MIDPEQLRVMAQRFDWAFETEGSNFDADCIAEVLRDLANGVDPGEICDTLDLPCEGDPDE